MQYIPLIVCLIGLLLFVIPEPPSNSKVTTIGKIMFGAGLVVTLFQIAFGRF